MKPDTQPIGMNCFSKLAILVVVALLVLVSAMSGCGGTKKVSATDQPTDQAQKSESVALTSGAKENAKNSPALE